MLLPGALIGPSFDASVFATVGWRLAEGDVLYVDVWDHKPPGLYFPYLAARLLTDDPGLAWLMVWLVGVAAIAVMAAAVRDTLARSGAGSMASGLAAFLAAIGASSYLLSLGGGLGETLALGPLSLAVAAAMRRRWVIAGLFAGIAMAVSLQTAPVFVVLVILATWDAREHAVARNVAWGGGAALVGLALLAHGARSGGLPAAADALIAYSAAYRAVPTAGAAGSVWAVVPWTVLVLLPLLIGLGLALVGRRRLAHGRLAFACLAWVALGIAMIVVQGRFYAHYATPLVIPLAILTGLGLDAGLRRDGRGVPAWLLAAPLFIGLAVSLVAGAAAARDEQQPIVESARRVELAAAVIGDEATAGDTMFVWGNAARLHEAADLAPALRYPYLYPLLTPGYASPELVAELVAQLENAPPWVVVDAGSLEPGTPGLPPLLIDRPVATDGRSLDLLDPLRDFVEERYRLLESVAGWPIYVLR